MTVFFSKETGPFQDNYLGKEDDYVHTTTMPGLRVINLFSRYFTVLLHERNLFCMKANLLYKIGIASSSIFVGVLGFWIGFNIMLRLFDHEYNAVLSMSIFVIGSVLLWLLRKANWQSQYDKSLSGMARSLPQSYLYSFTLGISMALVILPVGGIVAYLLNLLRVLMER